MKGGRFWIGVVVALLVGNAAAMGVLVALAGDPTPRVLPDYYRKAVAWDETAAAQRASDGLGWSAAPSLIANQATVVLTDASGAPVRAAAVEVTARHRSRADRQRTITLRETAPGRYAGVLVVEQPGLYELAITARRDADTFLFTALVER